MKYILLIFASFMACGFIADDTSFGTRGGGSGTAAEFYRLGNQVFDVLLPQRTVVVFDETIDIVALHRVFETVQIQAFNKELRLDDTAVDAINYPRQNRIELSTISWVFLTDDRKRQLVIHELLGLSRIQDTNYRISNEIINQYYALPLLKQKEAEAYVSGMEALTTYSLLQKLAGSSNPVEAFYQVTCTVDQRNESIYCSSPRSVGTTSQTDSEFLLSIFKKIGVPMVSPDGVLENYTVKRVACVGSPDILLQTFECDFLYK